MALGGRTDRAAEWADDDEVAWRLAVQRDADGLRARARELRGRGPSTYSSARADAFALAVEGSGKAAIATLGSGWTDAWPAPVAFALDVARVRLLSGEAAGALIALQLGLAGQERLPPVARDLVAACVRERRWLWRLALRVIFSAGSWWERAAGVAAVVRVCL
jgi:hypothetical protein